MLGLEAAEAAAAAAVVVDDGDVVLLFGSVVEAVGTPLGVTFAFEN